MMMLVITRLQPFPSVHKQLISVKTYSFLVIGFIRISRLFSTKLSINETHAVWLQFHTQKSISGICGFPQSHL